MACIGGLARRCACSSDVDGSTQGLVPVLSDSKCAVSTVIFHSPQAILIAGKTLPTWPNVCLSHGAHIGPPCQEMPGNAQKRCSKTDSRVNVLTRPVRAQSLYCQQTVTCLVPLRLFLFLMWYSVAVRAMDRGLGQDESSLCS